MKREKISIQGIPALVWGEPSEKVWLFVHGKLSCKDSAQGFAAIAGEKGYQTISFDLPRHGEREGEEDRCDIFNGIRDLSAVGEYVLGGWKEANLFGCSLGAFFCLHAYQQSPFQKALFQSPIVDMEYLIRQMMHWFDVPQERLEKEGEIDTPIDVLSWKYFQYVTDHPIESWNIPTCILFAGKDNLQSRDIMTAFAEKFDCSLTVAENSQHPFMDERDIPVVENWIRRNIS